MKKICSLAVVSVFLSIAVSQALAGGGGYRGDRHDGYRDYNRGYDRGHDRHYGRHHNNDALWLGLGILGGVAMYESLAQPRPGYGRGYYPQPMTCYSQVCGQWTYDAYGNRYCQYQQQVQVPCR